MKSKSILISIAIIVLVFNSCVKEGPEGPPGASGSALSGSLVGFVYLYDEYGVPISDKSGVTVTVDGYIPSLSATTNSSGKYQIDNMTAGTYDLIFSKTGYATYKSLSLSFVGGVKPRVFNTTLVQQATTTVSSLTVTFYSSTQFTLACTLAPAIPAGYLRYLRVYYGKNSTVSSTNYITTAAFGSSVPAFSSIRSFDKGNFPSSTSLYVIAYAESYYTYYYQDLLSGLNIYTTIGSTGSNVASIIVP